MDEINASLSENVQMYLVAIARYRDGDQPVPLSHLAEEFSISPSSVNEMCRKLEKKGYLTYQPYKGVLLTPQGEEKAYYILRRHRLWEVFLTEKLGFKNEDAHEVACQLEHTTPNVLANRLEAFLGNPVVNPLGEPIPAGSGDFKIKKGVPLSSLSPGQRAQILRCEEEEGTEEYLAEHGIRPGNTLVIQAVTVDNLLLQVRSQRVALANSLAENIFVKPEDSPERLLKN